MEKLKVSETSTPQSSFQTWLPLFLGIASIAVLPFTPARTGTIAYWIPLMLVLFGVIAAIVRLLRCWMTQSFAGAGKVAIGLMLCLLMAGFEVSDVYLRKLIAQKKNTLPIPTLRNFHGAQMSFQAVKGRFATLQELADENLIDRYYASSKPLQGYLYSSTDVSRTTYCIHADRAPGSASPRDFNITEEGVVRFIESPVKGTVPRGAGTPIILNNEE